ncbi:MAG TPA: DUF1844 domain-containing protein [Candidatus Omnitrophota bacterium]|nr:DUF1844 domain-containing protein [Candidatus Omnitrophota bacterium]
MEQKKSVDESWKESASKEKETFSNEVPQEPSGEPQEQSLKDIEINFLNYITSLGYQAMIFMGEIPHPITQQTDKNLMQAKFIIDTLIMLKDKTKGNLNEQEASLLEASVYELQMKFVELLSNEQQLPGQPSEGKNE